MVKMGGQKWSKLSARKFLVHGFSSGETDLDGHLLVPGVHDGVHELRADHHTVVDRVTTPCNNRLIIKTITIDLFSY